jgi:hypothetical protein
MEKKLPQTLQEVCPDWVGKPIRLMFQDEARFGRINDVRQCWATKPHRPMYIAMLTHEYTYALAAVEPLSGVLDALILPQAIPTACNYFSMS